MELRLWEFEKDDLLIDSFLEGMSVAHNEAKRSCEWFHWKFEQSPYGKSIMACAFDGLRVAGCVAYGRGIVRYQGRDWLCALSYETFVHPDYQGRGLFKKLIQLAEQEMNKSGIQFLYNFPNANSITGFKHMNWICHNDIMCFKVKINSILKVLSHLPDMRKTFQPNSSNLSEIVMNSLSGLTTDVDNDYNVISPLWTKEYIKWRFFTFPNREYFIIDNDDAFSIIMIGHRGRLKFAHILYTVSKRNKKKKDIYPLIIKMIKSNKNIDVISYESTIFDESINKVKGFFKVPSHGNFCYKVLDKQMAISDIKITLPSINAHTY